MMFVLTNWVTPTLSVLCLFFFNDTATTEIYTLSLHDALPIFEPVSAAYGPPLTAVVVPEFSPPSFWQLWLPIVMISIIFALMHYSHGLAWIPLTLLALGLDYIYQQTHRLLPSITVHFCLNALSMAPFWVQMFEAPQLQQMQGK